MTDEEKISHAEPIPQEHRNWNARLWFPQSNDLIGGWCIMTADKPPSQCDFREGEVEIGCFLDEETARRIAGLHNTALSSISLGEARYIDRDEAAARAFGEPVELLREWFEYWERDEDMPVKMPNSLHVRTACALYIATREHPLERRARRPLPPGPQRDALLRDLDREMSEADAAAALDDDLEEDKMVAKRPYPKSMGAGKNGPPDLAERGMEGLERPVVPLEQLYSLIDDLRDAEACVYRHGGCSTHDYPNLESEVCPHQEAKEVILLVDAQAQREAERVLDEAEAHAASEADRVAAVVKKAAAEINARHAQEEAEEMPLRRLRIDSSNRAMDGCIRVRAPEDLQAGEAVIVYEDGGVESDAVVTHIRNGNPPRNRIAHLRVESGTARDVNTGE